LLHRCASHNDKGAAVFVAAGAADVIFFGLVAINEIIQHLEREYGARRWQPDRDPIDVLIATILSQNTSDVNSGRAFASLKASFDTWEAVASVPADHIARIIESGGLSRIKAARIKQILGQIEKERGSITLDFLKSKTMSEAEDYLTALPGVGHKTASCVLLFSLGKPSLPVDTHILRVAKRLGLIDSKASADKAHSLLQEQVPASKVYQFHLHLIEHGRRVCRPRRPRCDACILHAFCPSALR
jgi:endonuclease-3